MQNSRASMKKMSVETFSQTMKVRAISIQEMISNWRNLRLCTRWQ